MAKVKADLAALKEKFGLVKDDVWDCHGTLVMLHRACEGIAQQLGITFDEPKLLFAEGKSIAIQVTGRLGDESSWSIGEASPDNNKNSYPWAMAEKRAKDRVILKLARFSEVGVYSDIEADDFHGTQPTKSIKPITFDSVAKALESAKTLAELDARALYAANLKGKERADAQHIYIMRKKELGG